MLLAIEGATLLDLRSLLTVHAFVGMLLIPVVVLKLMSTAWRLARYYARAEEYVQRGPPHVALRVVVAPLVAVSTVALFATGVVLLAVDRTEGTIVALHKASFFVWLAATSVHVLVHLPRAVAALRRRLPGTAVRVAVVAGAVAAGGALAVATLPGADRLQDHVTGRIGLDAR